MADTQIQQQEKAVEYALANRGWTQKMTQNMITGKKRAAGLKEYDNTYYDAEVKKLEELKKRYKNLEQSALMAGVQAQTTEGGSALMGGSKESSVLTVL